MADSTYRWHVVRGEESVAKFRFIADADAFAAATGGEVRDGLAMARSGQTTCAKCGRKTWFVYRSADPTIREGICTECRTAEKAS